MSIKAVIAGVGGSHDNTVASALKANSNLTDSEIALRGAESWTDTLAYANSVGAEIVIRSTTGLSGFITDALAQYPNIICFVPLGSNTYAELTDVSSIPCIVTSGAGNASATRNQTGYGNGLEFWDNESYGSGAAESSYSNGVIAGKLYTIKHTLNCSWWAARYRARMTASGMGQWNKYDGYGKIDVGAAVSNQYSWSSMPSDPFLTVAETPIVDDPTIATYNRPSAKGLA